MTHGYRRLFAFVFFAAALAAPAAAHDFTGERLTYEFGWQNISAATAAVSVDRIDSSAAGPATRSC